MRIQTVLLTVLVDDEVQEDIAESFITREYENTMVDVIDAETITDRELEDNDE